MLVGNRTQACIWRGKLSARWDWAEDVGFSRSLRVFVAAEVCDTRKGFEGLSGLVGSVLNEEFKRGALFAFNNRRRTRLKILYWDGSGLWVLSKRLEKGTFAWRKPRDGVGVKLPLRAEVLSVLMDGIDLRGVKNACLGRASGLIDSSSVGLRLECRSYELGPILWSFGQRSDLPELTNHQAFASPPLLDRGSPMAPFVAPQGIGPTRT